MKKMTKGLGLLTVVVLLFAFTGQADAFCVYNRSDKTMTFDQTSGGKVFSDFRATVDPGQKSCCHWSEKDCNKSGGKTDMVGFNVYYRQAPDPLPPTYVCEGVTIPACSALEVTGSYGNYKCVTHGMEICN